MGKKMVQTEKSAIGFFILLALTVVTAFSISVDSLLNLPLYWEKDEYSHGILIPIIAIFIGWHILVREKPALTPSWAGIPVLIISLLFSTLAELSAFEALLNYSFIMALSGIVLTFGGKKVTFLLLPVLVFLFFAAPLPHIVYGNLSLQMQLVSSTLGTNIIRLFGFSVFQDGNVIDLGLMKLQVAEACDGLRYLFPLMSLGYLAAYLMEDKWWKRGVVFLSVIPVTIIMNSLRIAIVGLTVNLWGQEMAEGVLHMFEGFVVFGICLILLLGEMWLFLHFGKTGRFRDEYLKLPRGRIFSGSAKITPPILVGLLLLFCGFLFFQSGSLKNRVDNAPFAPDFSTFPAQIGDWTGKRGFLTLEEIGILDLTDYWMADYKSDNVSAPVNLYVAYYNSQRMRANIHIPLNCILGSGWQVDSQSTARIETAQDDISVNRLVIRKGMESGVVYYWLEQRGRRISNPLKAKLFLAWDSIVMNRTDGALVRVSTPMKTGERPENADERLRKFLQRTYPAVEEFIPGR